MGLRQSDRPVRLDIDVLELHGFPAASRFAVTASFRRELERLIRVRGLPGTVLTGAAIAPSHLESRTGAPGARRAPAQPGTRASSVRLDPQGPASISGRAIARAVYRSLG